MLIVGAKGFAKEVLEVLWQFSKSQEIAFFDDLSQDLPDQLFNRFKILKSTEEVKSYFDTCGPQFTIGIGNPQLRFKLYTKLLDIGGVFTSTISPHAHIGHFNVRIEQGCNIMTGTILTNDIHIEKGCLINLNCTIGHDSFIDQFVELSPGVAVSGNCKIGAFTSIGTNATILPMVSIGQNVIVGAGAVVTKDIPDNCLALGIPAKVIKEFPSFRI